MLHMLIIKWLELQEGNDGGMISWFFAKYKFMFLGNHLYIYAPVYVFTCVLYHLRNNYGTICDGTGVSVSAGIVVGVGGMGVLVGMLVAVNGIVVSVSGSVG